jgi:hypothetical protein
MNRDRIERALREPGPRERGYSPEALPATAAELRARVPRRSRLLMSAGAVGGLAAAVAAGAVVAVVLSRGFSPGPATGGTVSSPTPTPSTVPTSAPTPAPAPVAACRAEDFAWSSDPWGGAAGSRGTTIVAKGVTSLVACELKGAATLVLRDANRTVLISGHTAATKITVLAGQAYQVGVVWSNWCGAQPAQPITFSLTLPNDTTPVPVIPPDGSQIPVAPCNGAGEPSTLSGTDFQPSDRAPEG